MSSIASKTTLVRDIVQTSLLSCNPDDSLLYVTKLMAEHSCSSILIMEDDSVLGIWTERDAVRFDFSLEENSHKPVSEVMRSPVKAVIDSMGLDEVSEQFRQDGFRHYLVTDKEGNRTGIISQTDVVLNYSHDFYLVPRTLTSIVKLSVPIIDSEALISKATSVMRETLVDAVAINFPDDVKGILTERDIIKAIATGDKSPTISTFATKGLISLNENESLFQAKYRMINNNIRHLGVTDYAENLIAIVNLTDILNGLRSSYIAELKNILDEKEASLSASIKGLQLAQKVIESSLEAVIITDKAGIIQSCNPAFTHITGFEESDVIGKSPSILSSGYHDESFYQSMWEQIDQDGHWQGEIVNRRKNGETYPELLTITAIIDEETQKVSHYAGIFSDISQVKKDEERIQNLAYFDPLTGLGNRRRMLDRLEHELALAVRKKHISALLFIDLDNFKHINDTLGHAAGDEVLCQTAQRLRDTLREVDTVARIGGDEFVIILPELDNNIEASLSLSQNLAEKIKSKLTCPYTFKGHELFVSPSIGITLFPENHDNSLELLKQADNAMYRAKDAGRNQIQFYHPSMQEIADERFMIMEGIRHALSNNEFTLNYQPQVDPQGNLIGAEALIRWNHPKHGFMSPAKFIPIAEESSLIINIGDWVLRQAFYQVSEWNKQGLVLPKLAVNISPRQFFQNDFSDKLSGLIEQYKIPQHQIALEITEGLMMDNIEEAIHIMTELKSLGFTFSVDDFGTGYSSLIYLQRLPMDQLKIDKAFVEVISKDDASTVIVDTIISMAKHMGFSVIAEGVENKVELDFLHEHGCFHYQGYYFSKPLPAHEFSLFCKDRIS